MSTKKNEAAPFRVEAQRSDLLRAVARAEMCVERRNTTPILGFVQLAMGFGTLAVSGTNLDVETRVEIEAQGEGAACLPARRLRDLLKALPDASVALVGNSDGVVTLTAGQTEATYGSLPAVDFPDFSVDHKAWSVTLPDGVFAYLVGGAADAMSTEETRYYLNGVCFEVKDGVAVATATDGHRLVSRTANLAGSIKDIAPVIIHRDAVRLGVSQIGAGEAVLTGYAPKPDASVVKVQIDGGDARLRSKCIDGTFPNWRRVVPSEDGAVVSFEVAGLLSALRMAKANASDRGRAVKLTDTGAGVRLSSYNPDCGTLSTVLSTEAFAPFEEFGCNAQYLAGFASAAARIGSKTLRLHLTGPGAPIKILPDEAIQGAMAVLMPMRV